MVCARVKLYVHVIAMTITNDPIRRRQSYRHEWIGRSNICADSTWGQWKWSRPQRKACDCVDICRRGRWKCETRKCGTGIIGNRKRMERVRYNALVFMYYNYVTWLVIGFHWLLPGLMHVFLLYYMCHNWYVCFASRTADRNTVIVLNDTCKV